MYNNMYNYFPQLPNMYIVDYEFQFVYQMNIIKPQQ